MEREIEREKKIMDTIVEMKKKIKKKKNICGCCPRDKGIQTLKRKQHSGMQASMQPHRLIRGKNRGKSKKNGNKCIHINNTKGTHKQHRIRV